MFLDVKVEFCYITVDFTTAASQNDVSITQQIHVCSTFSFMIKDESKKSMFSCQFPNNIIFIMMGKLVNTKPFCDAAVVAKSTVM